jgi:SAM-dependent methyltransferase
MIEDGPSGDVRMKSSDSVRRWARRALPVTILRAFRQQFRELRLGRGFRADFQRFERLKGEVGDDRLPLRWDDRQPCLLDGVAETPFDRHYVYHCAWAARVLARVRPDEHVDFGSSLNFVTIASAFVPMRFYDVRPPDLALRSLRIERANLTKLTIPDGAFGSVSCMHVVEHVGLGRYGDEIAPRGDLAAIRELQRVTAPGGSLLFVVPLGRPRIVFNAHRIYSYELVAEAFAGWELLEFTLIQDADRPGPHVIENADARVAAEQDYGCGCFFFRKPS